MDLDIHLDAIAAGDPDAFGRWLSGAELPLRASLRSFATRVDTEAVLQESLLRVWQLAPRVQRDGRPNSLLRVAYRIARNLAIDGVRRHRSEPLPSDQLMGDPVTPSMPDPLLQRAIAECREQLPAAPARALSARLEAQGVRHDQELADQSAMTLNTFLKNVGRARKLLVECLRRRGVELS